MFPLFDNNRRKGPVFVTAALILANLAVFTYQLYLGPAGRLEGFILEFAFIPGRLTGEPGIEAGRSVFTSMFLHGSLLHLASNLWFLWLFGNIVEDRLGAVRFVLLYLLAGLGAAFAQFAVNPFSPIPMVGASGAIAGVLGAYLLLFPKAIIFTFVPIWFAPIIPVPAVIFLMVWFLIQVWYGIGTIAANVQGGVAWWAHFGGFVAGVLIVRRMRIPLR